MPNSPIKLISSVGLMFILSATTLFYSARTMAFELLVMGDSLSAAYGISVEQGWVSLLADRTKARGVNVINHSIPGETTYGGIERISQVLEDTKPDLVILALGANDGLQGLDMEKTRSNLAEIIKEIKGKGSQTLLFGMKIPPNYGRAYTDQFHQNYLDLAESFDIPIVPFFIETVALDYDLMQLDGYHPNATAQPLILDHIWPALEPLLPK